MPQPIRKPCHFEISGLVNRPQHSVVIGHIIGMSGRLEAALGWLLALFSGGSAPITVSMFHAVVSTDAQRAMLLAAAEKALAGAELEEFRELMGDFRSRYKERSKLVHNLWGHSNDHPDKALWISSSDAGSNMADLAASTDFQAWLNGADLSTKCLTYTVQDLTDVAVRLDEYLRRVLAFLNGLIQNHPALVAATISSTNTPPIGEESQLDLRQSGQTDHQ